jgi:biopolymer transport protein ExbD
MRESAKHINRSRTGWRTIAIKPVANEQAEINVTPLIDVVLVLLIIFMVVTPLAEKDLSVVLASEKRTTEASAVAATQVAIVVDPGGQIAINGQPISREDYVAALRKLLSGRRPEDQVVFVVADDNASYPQLVAAIDGAKQAGAATIGLAIGGTP